VTNIQRNTGSNFSQLNKRHEPIDLRSYENPKRNHKLKKSTLKYIIKHLKTNKSLQVEKHDNLAMVWGGETQQNFVRTMEAKGLFSQVSGVKSCRARILYAAERGFCCCFVLFGVLGFEFRHCLC
jgi:hypothetical protein